MLPEPTARLRFRPMEMADLDDITRCCARPTPTPTTADALVFGRRLKRRGQNS